MLDHSVEDDIITFEEWSGYSSAKLHRTASVVATSSEVSVHRLNRWVDEAWGRISGAFVPEGFPSSVSPDYLPFQVWDSLQGLSTYIRSMLSTQALLNAIGVGEKSATVLGATFQWFVRDFTGMLGGVLFTFYQGSELDCRAKMWRLVADLMNDIGMLMDLISPLYPSVLAIIVCLGSLSRSVTGVASGATRAALTQHFSLQNNAADISAKEGSQETLVTMLGMVLGMLLTQATMDNPLAIWLCFVSLTAFHIYANYKAVRCISLTTLNRERCSIILQHFMQNFDVLSPQEVSCRESVLSLPIWTSWFSNTAALLDTRIDMGLRVSLLTHSELKNISVNISATVLCHYDTVNYMLFERGKRVCIIIHKDATELDILRSFIHASVLASLMGKTRSLHEESKLWMEKYCKELFCQMQERGWNTDRLLSSTTHWRAKWNFGLKKKKM